MGGLYPRVLPVGDRAVTVELGDSLDLETIGRVRALDERVRESAGLGVLETVPTYAALLVIYDRGQVSFAELRGTLLRTAEDLTPAVPTGRRVEIPARYDGEDLGEVAQACGLTEEAVVERHAGRDYDVLMLGFSPGFAYLGFLDERLRVPRRKTPRTRVPAGAIAVAGAQTGIYPRTLPGGWNLIGRTTARLFDTSCSHPSLLMPGDRVRFLPARNLDPGPPVPKTLYLGADVEVVEAGVLTTIQDAGRRGLGRVAVPQSGYADAGAAKAANEWVGNGPGAPIIEICGSGLKLRFERTTSVALAGARVTACLEREDLHRGRMAVSMNAAVRVRASNTLTISGLEDGVRAYVAISGLQAPSVLGSSSVDLGSGFLRPLEPGDRFSLESFDPERVRREPMAAKPRPGTARVILGPQLDRFDRRTIETFLSNPWCVGPDSDRVGARLDGPRLGHVGGTEIVSDGMVPGCIQVPPDGRPIVMLADGPTTGGYPKIACVVSDDLGMIAQAIPGRTAIRFTAVQSDSLTV